MRNDLHDGHDIRPGFAWDAGTSARLRASARMGGLIAREGIQRLQVARCGGCDLGRFAQTRTLQPSYEVPAEWIARLDAAGTQAVADGKTLAQFGADLGLADGLVRVLQGLCRIPLFEQVTERSWRTLRHRLATGQAPWWHAVWWPSAADERAQAAVLQALLAMHPRRAPPQFVFDCTTILGKRAPCRRAPRPRLRIRRTRIQAAVKKPASKRTRKS